jgi:hypothetical protein
LSLSLLFFGGQRKVAKESTALQLGLRLPSEIPFTGGITNSLRSDSVLPFFVEKNFLGCVAMGSPSTFILCLSLSAITQCPLLCMDTKQMIKTIIGGYAHCDAALT